jgi:hypothetical protein
VCDHVVYGREADNLLIEQGSKAQQERLELAIWHGGQRGQRGRRRRLIEVRASQQESLIATATPLPETWFDTERQQRKIDDPTGEVV